MKQLKSLLSEYWFWLGLTTLHRLFSIMQPPLEIAHNWRQTTVCMVARNFLETSPNIFYPRVDMAGALTGITGMEFPLLNYLIYLVSLPFGYDHWYGRLINLVVTNTGLWCFYKYLKGHWDKKTAFATCMLVLFSLFYYYSRKIMPDTFSIALVMIGLYQWDQFSKSKNLARYLFGGLFVLAGVLSKLPAVLVLVFLLPLWFRAGRAQRALFSVSLCATALASAWWYFHWVPYLETTFGYEHFFMGKSMAWTLRFLGENWVQTLDIFYEKAMGYSGFALFLAGLVFLPTGGRTTKAIALSGFAMLAVLMLKSGEKFTDHEYYILPFVPVMAFIGAQALHRAPMKWVAVALVVYGGEGIVRKWEDQFIKRGRALENLDEMISGHVAKDGLIAVNSGEYPTPLYFAHRKGWLASNEQLQDPQFIGSLRSQGCTSVLVLKKGFGSMVELPLERAMENEMFVLYTWRP